MRTPNVSRTLPRLLVLASLSVACGSSDADSGSDIPEFGLPGTTPTPGAVPTPGVAPTPGTPGAPGVTTPVGTEGQGTPPLAAPGTPGAPAPGGAAVPGAPVDPAAPPAVPGTGSMVDVTIEAETLNQAASVGFTAAPGAPDVGGMEVASTICYDNIDLTGVQSIDLLYARKGTGMGAGSFRTRFAVLWGSGDVTTAENLGERVTVETGEWNVFRTLNVGLSRAVNEVGQLCFRGMQGNGIFNLDSFTLRGTPGTNDGVTDFNPPVPTGPAVAPVRVVGSEVQFGGPGTSLAGNSFFWSNGRYGGDLFYDGETVKWLASDWGTRLVRAAMAVDDNKDPPGTPIETLGGYLTPRERLDNKLNVQKIVNAAIESGIYVIIDWHAHRAEDNTAEAVAFFTEMATIYGGFENVMYEIYNEPVNTGWPAIKSYAEQVIDGIRSVDPDNLIIVGTPFYSQRVDEAAADPIDRNNIAYTLHFYAASHGQGLRDTAVTAMNNGIALMVTEWGATDASGQGAPNAAATQEWMTFLKANNISHANWSVTDLAQGSAGLMPGASPSGGWTDADLSPSGQLVKGIIQGW